MEEIFLFLLGCGVLLTLVGAPVVLVITWRRARRLDRELKELRAEVRELEESLSLMARAREAVAPPPMTAPRPAPAPYVAPVPPVEVAVPRPEARSTAAGAPAAATGSESGARGAPPPRARPPAAAARSAPRVAIDWERWLGVRGAAVVGGIFLALAAIFFFKHAFTQGWISPEARVLAGLASGAAAIVAAWRLRGRGFGWAPSALEGAGVVALYASVWAADERYALISTVASFPAMAAITALACALALRHGSLFSALLGLAGGFLTPLLLADGPARTLPMFGYLMLLDVGLLVVARRRGWPSLALCALLATFAYEGFSIFAGREPRGLGLAIAAGFALVFALAAARGVAAARARWLPTQALGVLLPFAFALHYADRFRAGLHVWPTAGFVALLVVSAALIARQQDVPLLSIAAALGAVGVVLTWVNGLVPQDAYDAAPELAGVALGLALVSHALAEWEHARGAERDGWRRSAAASALAWSLLLVYAAWARRVVGFPELACGSVALALLLVRQARLLATPRIAWAAGLVAGLVLGITHGGYSQIAARVDASLPDPRFYWSLPLVLAAALIELARRMRGFERAAPQAAGALLVACTLAVLRRDEPGYGLAHPWLPALAVPFGGLLLLVAVRLASSAWTGACAATTTALAIFGWAHSEGGHPEFEQLLALHSGFVVVIVAGSTARALDARRWAWAFLALLTVAPILWIELAWEAVLLSPSEGLGSLAAGLPAALAAAVLRARRAPNPALGWMAGAAALAFSSALADRIDHAEFALSCALFALAVAWIGRRLALRGASWAGVGSAFLAASVLLGMALDPHTFERSEHRLVNWLAYAYLVPAAAIALVAWWLPREGRGRWLARARAALGVCVLGLVFLWINLAIENAYSKTERLVLYEGRDHARDLTASLAWGLYALVLLVLGTARRVTPLRWASLAILLLSIAKVFLHDLAHLEGLYRVASLTGLALSLIAVSLFYQRFVFRRVGTGQSA